MLLQLYLLSMHSYFNSTYMYILPQLPRLTNRCPLYIDSVPVPPVYSLAIVILLLLFNYVTFISYFKKIYMSLYAVALRCTLH